jgi:PAS domain S-box-containing protein
MTHDMALAIVHSDDRPRVEAAIERSLSNGTPFEIELRAPRPDGSIWWLASKAAWRESPGDKRLIGLVQDITERNQAEERLGESEERFRALVALSSDRYWEQDGNFRFTAFSESREGLSGSSIPQLIGRTRWEIPSHGISAEQWAQHRAQLERHEPFRDFEFARTTPAAEPEWVSISGEPRFDADGQFAGYRGIGRNVTAQRRLVEALRAGEERFRTLAAAAPIGIFRTEIDGSFNYVNEWWANIAGMAATQSYGAGWAEALHPDDRARVLETWEQSVRQHRPFTAEYRFIDTAGGTTWVQRPCRSRARRRRSRQRLCRSYT